MIEIFKNTNYDFIGKGKYLIIFTIVTSILGVASFILRGFNMGIDFSGGTLVNVRFNKPHDDSQLRAALAKRGIDATKVVIQPISAQIGEAPKNEVLIRMPQTFTNENVAGGIDADKRAIAEALANNYSQVPPDVRASKVDVNNNGREAMKNALLARDPLGYRQSQGEAAADAEYAKVANAIVEYRDKERGGLITDVSEIPLGGFPPQLGDAIKNIFYAGDFSIINAEVVGPQVGKELRNRAIYVTLASLIGMLFYIAFRFEWIYGVAAVLAVVHDVIITLAFFSIFQWEISLNVIAALLTLIGYSMNDTIVIFDRIREMVKLKKREDISVVSNAAINETLSRTTITSGLTFMSVLALVLFGGPVLRGFSLTLFIGILVGTYSSIAIATPIMLWGQHYMERRAAAKKASEPTPAKGAGKGNIERAAKPKSGGGKAKASNAKAS